MEHGDFKGFQREQWLEKWLNNGWDDLGMTFTSTCIDKLEGK